MDKDMFKELLSSVNNNLKLLGFAKKGDTFLLMKKENWQLINFQKSRDKGPSGSTRFTINLGICSSALRKYLQHKTDKEYPEIEDCHWNKRIGFLMTQNGDHWWELREGLSLENIKLEINDIILRMIIPELDKYVADESLEESWLANKCDGITDLQKYVYLTSLLKIRNKENLQQVAAEMRKFGKGRSYEIAVIEHLKELGLYETA